MADNASQSADPTAAAPCPPPTSPATGFDAYEINSFHQQDGNAGKVITLLLCSFFFYTVVVTIVAGWWTLATLR